MEEQANITLTLDTDSARQLEQAIRTLAGNGAATGSSMIQQGAYPTSAGLLTDVNIATNFCQALREQREKVNAD